MAAIELAMSCTVNYTLLLCLEMDRKIHVGKQVYMFI